MAFLAHLLVVAVAVGWSAGRPSTGMGHIVGLPDAPHDAGTFARKALRLFSLPSVLHMATYLVSTVASYIGHVIASSMHAFRLPATLIHAMLTSLPVQRCASCQCCITMLAAATIHSTICII